MMRVLQFLFFGHIHKWKTIDERRLNNSFGGVGSRYIQQCDHCGIVKKRDLI